VWGRYCACETLIASPIDWLYAVCLEYFIFFAIDSSGARKQYDELSPIDEGGPLLNMGSIKLGLLKENDK
jgi:hypothetical protein